MNLPRLITVLETVAAAGRPLSASELQDSLLTQAGVAILAGTSFGALGEGYLRFSYASSMENIERALERVANHLQPA